MASHARQIGLTSLGVLAAIALVMRAPATQAAPAAEQALAKQILEATGVHGGLIVHLGCGEGKLTAALRAGDGYLVHGLDRDAANIQKARELVRSLGLEGKVSVERWTESCLPYTDNLANLVVAEDLGAVPLDEVMRVLAPNGVAYVRQGGTWTKTVKPRPAEIDEWTHFLHSPNNNAVADDGRVGPPRHLQWVGGPKWARSHDHLASISAAVSSAGRIFYIVDEAPAAFVALPAEWRLVARDAFNGVVLWKRPIKPWEGELRGFRSGPPELPRRLVAVGDRVYVTLGYGQPLTALDAATGEIVRTYPGTEGTLEIVCSDGLLYLVAGDMDLAAAVAQRRGASPPPRNRRILVLEADTGNRLWTKADADTAQLMPVTLAVAKGRLFFQNTEAVVCLDAKTGEPCWRASRPISVQRPTWSTPTLVVYDDVVLSADRAAPAEPSPSSQIEWILSSRGGEAPVGELIAFSAATGERLWSCDCREVYNHPVDVLVADGLVWTGNMVRANEPGITEGRDVKTGEIKRRRPPDSEFFHVGMGHHRCYRNKATSHYLVLGRSGVELIDLATGHGTADHWVRGVCQYGVMPCNGLIYAPSHSCACYIEAKLNGFNALAPKSPTRQVPKTIGPQGRLEKGPAYGQLPEPKAEAASSDWPTYRHDPARSGRTPAAVPADLKPAWQTALGGKLSSLVVAEGKVLTAQIEAHTVRALSAEDGRPLWSYTAAGRIDSPPTIDQGLVLFAAADGYAYCLRASDGELVWRFRAAPEDRRIVAYGQLESVWPLHGSVLVEDGVVWFAAGRSSYVDGGMRLYRLDAQTGKLLSETCIDHRDPKTGEEPKEIVRGTYMPGALPDVLSSDGTSVFMRHLRFDRSGVVQEPNVPHLFCPAGFLDDSWWHRTYWFFGTKMGCAWGGWPQTGNQIPAGRILACDADRIYGFGRHPYARHGSHVGLEESQSPYTGNFKVMPVVKTHYRLFCADKKANPAPAGGKRKRRGQDTAGSNIRYHWIEEIPLLVRAMVLADQTLLIAGPPDVLRTDDPAAAWEGKRGGLLWAVSAADGKRQAELKLASPPVFDGMAAANGRLYLATMDGKVLCLGQ